MNEHDGEGFLGRWSRRKQQARSGQPDLARNPADATGVRPSGADAASADHGTAGTAETRQRKGDEPERMLGEEDFADVDFGLLDAGSDYKRFMASNVPNAIRDRALAKLWTSIPAFAGLDPIHDYHGDYTDAAVAVPEGIKTAYRVGRGFLTDEEVTAWENLGKPEPKPHDKSVEPTPEPEPQLAEASADAQPDPPAPAEAAPPRMPGADGRPEMASPEALDVPPARTGNDTA